MFTTTARLLASICVCVSLIGVANAQDTKLAKLLVQSPAPANAIAYVHVPSLNKLMSDAEFSSRLTDNVNDIWLISDLDLSSLRPRWEAGYAMMKSAPDAEKIASATGGYVDSIIGTPVVWSPRQSYLVPLEDNRLGFLRPANRSLLSRWIQSDADISDSSYLAALSKQPESYLSFMIAADVRNLISPVPLAEKLKKFTSLKSNQPDSVASTLASVKGFSVIIGRDSLGQCIFTIDFEKSPASLKTIANELLAEILERNGTAAPEVLSWEVKSEGNQLAFKGAITEASLGGLLNIFTLSTEANNISNQMIKLSDSPGSAAEQVAYTTKHYFDEVNKTIEQVRKHKSQTTGGLAKWNDQQARKLDAMGTLNVDPVMVQYGSDVAELLRGNALNVRSTNIQAGKAKASQGLSSGSYYGYGRGYGYGYGYGYSDPNSSADYQRVTDAYARGTAYADFRGVLSQIDKMTASMRRQMTDKYKMQF
ncbi:putative secreted protein [Rhodopirellula sallentina SM41]|uniref:Putative secreted protein n=1 Tax=Rhodopirellula sallentina SM41 TaxID=1263870 RepID=M5UGP7_9BACT|nr:putative secreted protein [Rhodopirellula sallentina SM41]